MSKPEKTPKDSRGRCVYCANKGWFSDELSGGESYCTCIMGKALAQAEAE